jgi:alpha-mannosidase
MGSDFQYVAAQGAYMNMDKLIKYVNLGTATHGVNMFYSTPAEYTDARLAADVTWPIKTDDYMPYCDG